MYMSDAADKSYAITSLDAGSILDHAIYLYRDRFKLVAALMGLFLFPMLVVMDAILLSLEERMADPVPVDMMEPLVFAGFAIFYSFLLQVLVLPVASGALAYGIALSYMGKPVTASACVRHAVRRAHRLIGAAIVAQTLILLGSMMCVVPGIYAQIVFIPLYTIITLEDASIFGSLSRCNYLMQGERLKGLLLLFVVMIVSGASGVLDVFLGLPYFGFIWADAIQAFAAGLPITAWTVFYFSARSRTEHLDVELAVQDMEQGLPAEAVAL
jgi:hypothetical protein